MKTVLENSKIDHFQNSLQQKNEAKALVDNRPETIQQKNNTGLPSNLKTGIENLSGHSMDDVKVHYNSARPAQLNAHAYAQGTDIHLASGQEKHLAHEAWHVVQQKQGRVKPTMQMKGKVNVNDDAGLEKEADVMGARATLINVKESSLLKQNESTLTDNRHPIAQRKIQNHTNRNALSDAQGVVQRVEISLKTVSKEVLSVFMKMAAPLQHMILNIEELPSFFRLSSEEQISYFKALKHAIPMLDQLIQAQASHQMISDQEHSQQSSNVQNQIAFFLLNPNFIEESISLFMGTGASFHFFNPSGKVSLQINSFRALMPQSMRQIQGQGHGQQLVLRQHQESSSKEKVETEEERIHRKKQQYTNPTPQDIVLNKGRNDQDKEAASVLLIKSLRKFLPKKIVDGMTYEQLELEHAKFTYMKGELMAKPSMKKIVAPNPDVGLTQIDIMRQNLVANPDDINHKDYAVRASAGVEDQLLTQLMPQLVKLSHFIRLTHYYDSTSEESILDSGRLQSKERRILKAGGDDVPNKSGKLDDELGNTDHVFFFAEYDDGHPAPFRNTRFGGEADVGDAILHQKDKLDGTERRVSFPLNAVPMRGVHGYLDDLNSKPSLNPVHDVFSASSMSKKQRELVRGHSEDQSQSSSSSSSFDDDEKEFAPGKGGPAPGAHLLMDLLRQRFKQSNFPGKKTEDKMIADLMKMTMRDLYTFLFRQHPGKQKAEKINPQILVPGSVPFTTPGVRFDKPSDILKDGDLD